MKILNYFFVCLVVTACVLCPHFSIAATDSAQADFIPWSGYWWPYQKGGLSTGQDYRGHPAPLEKYELLTLGSYPGDLVSWYESNHYDPDAPYWYGLCTSFSRAACYENVEIFPSSEDNIIFRVGDKKGLLTLAHSDDIVERAEGSSPDVFHYWLLNYIKDQGKAFVADLDAGEEVWSYPVYAYDMESETDGNKESVAVTIWYADDFVSPDYVGTDTLAAVYTYDLSLDGEAIIGGEWTGQSVDDHPDRVHFPLEAQTDCPYLDYEEVLRLAQSKDDSLENAGETVDIAPGTYNLILLDEDVYSISCAEGDTVSIYIEKQRGSSEDLAAEIVDGKGEQISNATIGLSEPMNLLVTVEDPPCIISLSQEDYSDPNIYTLQIDQVKAFNQKVPYVPKNGKWSGFAVTNPADDDVTGVILTTYTQEGQPLQTLLGPLDLFPGEKRLFLFDDLPWRQWEYSDINKLALMSDSDINFLNLFAYAEDSLACFVQGSAKGSRFIIPDTVSSMAYDWTMFGGVENESFEQSVFSMSLYSMDGELKEDINSMVLDPRETFSFKPGSDPFYNMPNSGWIEVTGNQDALLNGYQYIGSGTITETLFGLPADSSQKIVPHIPPPGYWTTTVTVINPNDQENGLNLHLKLAGEESGNDMSIIMSPYEKKVLELQDQFGKDEGDPLYHSILEINGEYPVAGYYTFTAPMEEASLPLLGENDFKEELVLPHYPGNDGYWWTGVCIFNPSSSPVEVIVEPCDGNGNVMEDVTVRLDFEAGAYETFEVGSFFGASASDISFVKFRVEEETQGLIGGFYLYGNTTMEMLSGANM